MNTKSKKNSSVQVEYIINVVDIKPWPPSMSLRSVRSVILHWENGDRSAGQTGAVAPAINGDNGKIVFNNSFKITVVLPSNKSKDKRNLLEFSLYEPRRDKTQLLATATVDLSECGILKSQLEVNTPMSSKRSLTNTCQPVLCVKIQPVQTKTTVKRMSIDQRSVSSAEAESYSFTDDDASSLSSLMNKDAKAENDCESVQNDTASVGKEEESRPSISDIIDELEGRDKVSISDDRAKHEKLTGPSLDVKRVSGLDMAVTKSKSFTANTGLESKVQRLENRIRMLENELTEVAAIEAALYSVAAQHTSSVAKVHTPARRLARLYINACKDNTLLRKTSVAKSCVSGLVLVAKACGNDVPRLSFWLSNAVVLRTMVAQQCDEKIGKEERAPKWRKNRSEYDVVSCIEKVEAWIFSRIVESIWWQALVPYMQSNNRYSHLNDEKDQGYAIDNWKSAFKEACDRLCPVRAGGNECGCLRTLTKLVMEQCLARLDVAMFNAILRESNEGISSDPMADPISNSNVLPIPPGASSFGAGAQLKTAIGNWSRWLTDMFGIDEDDSVVKEDDDRYGEESFKSFLLLKELSDLMMLPKDMLLNKSIRKEVCPTLDGSLIWKILKNFSMDEFCSDPVPESVFEALGREDGEARTMPRVAGAPVYVAAWAAAEEMGPQLQRNGSWLMRKGNGSDDELDELESPLDSILSEASSPVSWKGTYAFDSVRYRRLRDVWMNCH